MPAKKTPAQLQREIDEALAKTSAASVSADSIARLLDRLRLTRQAAFAASRLKSRAAKKHGLTADYWAKQAERSMRAKRYDEAREDLDRAESYVARAARGAGF